MFYVYCRLSEWALRWWRVHLQGRTQVGQRQQVLCADLSGQLRWNWYVWNILLRSNFTLNLSVTLNNLKFSDHVYGTLHCTVCFVSFASDNYQSLLRNTVYFKSTSILSSIITTMYESYAKLCYFYTSDSIKSWHIFSLLFKYGRRLSLIECTYSTIYDKSRSRSFILRFISIFYPLCTCEN